MRGCWTGLGWPNKVEGLRPELFKDLRSEWMSPPQINAEKLRGFNADSLYGSARFARFHHGLGTDYCTDFRGFALRLCSLPSFPSRIKYGFHN
jgi:hypothetical protein